MSDKDILNDILFITKAECDLYMHGTIEASSPNVHETFKNVLLETIAIQHETYKTMENKGWYQAEQVQKQKIEQTKQKLANS
ncbi:MAG TPA: spore coat protein [Acholeplasmataceae bacterium]|nr:spore coat protein [Acholeplasmataceae bacterium]